MRTACIAALALLVSLPSAGQPTSTGSAEGPQGYVLWNGARVEAAADRLEHALGDKAMVYETVGNYEGHSIYLVLRGKTGAAEFHATESDLYIAKRGSATFVIGGELVDAVERPRKQRRGTSIRGGHRQPLSPGDIVHVPVAVPHHLIIDPAQPFMYILVKFDEEPLE